MTMTNVSIEGKTRTIPAYMARPTTPGPWPAVVVLHDAFGMTSVLRGHTDWLADAGFLAVGPSLFPEGKRRMVCMRAVMRDVASGHGPSFDDVEATRSWLSEQDGCTGRIGVVGFCMTGGFALALAARHGFSASAPNYGALPKDPAMVLEGACPIVASFGGRDFAKGAAAKLEQVLVEKGIPHDVKEYPDAGHSFMDNFAPGEGPRLLHVVMRMLGQGYHEPSMLDARRRIVAFFENHLADRA
jgi:carboxymethylenebutenolidase